jgi:tyrosyl-tRNA synthetase
LPIACKTWEAVCFAGTTCGTTEQYFQIVFQRHEIPDEMDEIEIAAHELEGGTLWIIALLSQLGLVSSNSEARRMILQGGVRIDQEKVNDVELQVSVEEGMVVQVGRRKFARVKITSHN